MSDLNRTIDDNATSAKVAVDDAASATKRVADRARADAETARAAFQDHVVDPAKRAGSALAASGNKAAEGSREVGVTLIDQAEANAREAFSAMRAAAGARDLTEALRIQGEFLREQGDRSAGQAREIGALIARFGAEMVAPLRSTDGN